MIAAAGRRGFPVVAPGRRAWAARWSLGLALATACAPAPHEFDAAHQAAIVDSIGVFLEAYRQYADVGNWDALLGLYADTATFRWLEDGTVTYASVADIRAAIADLAPGTRIVTQHDHVVITPLAPGVAWVSMGFESVFLGPGGPSYGFAGAITMAIQHRATGWQIVGGHASTALPDSGRAR